MRIGLYGGSFNPPHIGHSLVCHYLLQTTALEKIWLIPTYRHPFGKPLEAYDARLELCQRLAQPFDGHVEVSDIERQIDAVSYTIDTVRCLLARHPDHTFDWIIGADILRETSKWKDYDLLRQLVSFQVLGRQGFEGGELLTMPEVSSTQIRQRLADGLPVDHLMPKAVLAYVLEQGLYRKRGDPSNGPPGP